MKIPHIANRWTEKEDAILRRLEGVAPPDEIGKLIGRTAAAVQQRRAKIGLAQSQANSNVSKRTYMELLTQVCTEAGKPLDLALRRSRKKESARLRWAAWAILRARGVSLPNIGRVAGYHHTSVLNGVRRCSTAK
jgi:hypothetical protein